jgi:hypothetical protein
LLGTTLMLATEPKHAPSMELIVLMVDGETEGFIFIEPNGKTTTLSLNKCSESDECTALVKTFETTGKITIVKLHSPPSA